MLVRITLLPFIALAGCFFIAEIGAQAPQQNPIGVTVKKTPTGLQIVNVTEKSLGAQLKLAQDDFILKINDRDVGSQMELMKAFDLQKKLTVLIRRGSKENLIKADVFWPIQGVVDFEKNKNGGLTYADYKSLPPIVIKLEKY